MSSQIIINEATTTLQVKRIFNAPREQIFNALTMPEKICLWFGPGDWVTREADVDLRVGGTYCYKMQSPEGSVCYNRGVFQEISFPELLKFTWTFEQSEGEVSADYAGESLVTIKLREKAGKTELTLSHERLPGEDARKGLEYGWNSGFDNLDSYLSTRVKLQGE